MSWMMTAKQAAEQSAPVRKTGEGLGLWGPRRFWVPKNTKKNVVFVDDAPAVVYEHTVRVNGRFTPFSCSNEPLAACCQALGQKRTDKLPGRSTVYHYTIVDMSSWEDKNGNTVKNELKLFPAKYYTQEALATKKAEEGGLAGKIVQARRFSRDNEPSVGSEHIVKTAVQDPDAFFAAAMYGGRLLSELYDEAESDPLKLEELKKIFQLEFSSEGLLRRVPQFNYLEVLKPPNQETLATYLAGYVNLAQPAAAIPAVQPDDDIPF